jgi:hypothetical protein
LPQRQNALLQIWADNNGSPAIVAGRRNILQRSVELRTFLSAPSVCPKTRLDAQGTYDYLFAHYGGPGGGTVWFIGNLSGLISIPQIGFGHGLSGWALFGPGVVGVPDGGATVMLLGAALGMLGVARRFLARRT